MRIPEEARKSLDKAQATLKELGWRKPYLKLRSLVWRGNLQVAKANPSETLAHYQIAHATGSILRHHMFTKEDTKEEETLSEAWDKSFDAFSTVGMNLLAKKLEKFFG